MKNQKISKASCLNKIVEFNLKLKRVLLVTGQPL